jgi:GAF domain-containing protein
MPDDRLVRILTRLAGHDDEPSTTRLCVVCAEVTAMSGAGIMLMLDDRPHGSLCTTNDTSAVIEELQYTLGEGPCIDAHRQQRPVLEPDLANPALSRWSAFAAPAVAAGARAIFGFPVAVDEVHLGALNLYRDHPGPLSDDQHADARILADVAARSIIGMQAVADPGSLGSALEEGTDFRYIVHQAAGMISVQLGIPVADALLRLRAHAFGHDRRLTDLARDVVERRLRLGPAERDDPA